MLSKEIHHKRIAIIGLGLMGGSMAFALHGKCKSLVGFDADIETRKLAEKSKIFDCITADPGEILSAVDLIILSVPVFSIIKIIPKLPEWISTEVAVMDLGSTKVNICKAMDALPDFFHTVGGHPMCGKEKLGFQNAEQELFHGATFTLVQTRLTTAYIRNLAEQLVITIGANPFWLDAQTHDQWVAATSHLPFLLAAALSLATPEEVFPLIGPGFQSTSRLAATSANMMVDVILDNRRYILNALKTYNQSLMSFEKYLENYDIEGLHATLQHASILRQSLINRKE